MKTHVPNMLIFALLVLLMSGCNASKPATLSPETSSIATEPVEVPMKTVYLPLTEIYTYAGGETKTITYVYDENLHLTAINHGIGPNGDELICAVSCDSYGRVTQIDHAGSSRNSQKFTYDDFWRIASLEDKYTTTQYIYSPDGHLEKLNSSSGWNEVYTYENGLLAETALYNTKGEKETWTTYTYDDQGRIIKKQQCSVGCEPEVGLYNYSDDGLSYSLEFGGATQVFTYDAEGNLVSKEYISSYFSYTCVYTYQPIEIPANLQWTPYQDNYCN